MLSTVLLIIAFSLLINWMISLSMLSFSTKEKKIRIRSAILCTISGLLLGYVVYLL
jgi:hypothetical protein